MECSVSWTDCGRISPGAEPAVSTSVFTTNPGGRACPFFQLPFDRGSSRGDDAAIRPRRGPVRLFISSSGPVPPRDVSMTERPKPSHEPSQQGELEQPCYFVTFRQIWTACGALARSAAAFVHQVDTAATHP